MLECSVPGSRCWRCVVTEGQQKLCGLIEGQQKLCGLIEGQQKLCGLIEGQQKLCGLIEGQQKLCGLIEGQQKLWWLIEGQQKLWWLIEGQQKLWWLIEGQQKLWWLIEGQQKLWWLIEGQQKLWWLIEGQQKLWWLIEGQQKLWWLIEGQQKLLLQGEHGGSRVVCSPGSFDFEVSDCFLLGCPLGLVLAMRKTVLPSFQVSQLQPACSQLFNLFYPSDPSASRLEPLLHPRLRQLSPFAVPRYHRYPLGDGRSTLIADTVLRHRRLSVALEADPPQGRAAADEAGAVSEEDGGDTATQRTRTTRSDSHTSTTSQQQVVSHLTDFCGQWWGSKRLDYVLFCPDVLTAFPTVALPHLFHASYWESTDAVAFILRQCWSVTAVIPQYVLCRVQCCVVFSAVLVSDCSDPPVCAVSCSVLCRVQCWSVTAVILQYVLCRVQCCVVFSAVLVCDCKVTPSAPCAPVAADPDL
ncbi:hypothetical protein ACEWY4_008920 [Coilia grayii]|uniref:DDHD domain-containing protein n=1 Tax=Coilia grayii TaxID=363190 RepID=A0ABD1K581_9TELE